ncbi:DEAD/DEAH box helicase [bacterium]|nr:DEAD/DEAH box helicase [bacterium]
MTKDQIQFRALIQQLNQRAARAVVSQLALRSNGLAQHLRDLFEQPPGHEGSFLAEPVFEATFGWKKAPQKMSALAGQLLAPELIEALDNPPVEFKKEYRFARNWSPYLHQLQSWQTLLADDWRSVLVTSGTASGKTECFLIPILQDLVQEWQQLKRPLTGVRALFLYPLNALINSQQQRLKAWTAAFKGNIRFCLYNGETQENVKKATQEQAPEQILSRNLLRKEPSPLLVTNATMLEYMLVRNNDKPIIRASRGKLRWIVLDEAHTYIGSQAAELTLLLRRVMHAFDVDPNEVRFVATSATIGDVSAESSKRLQRFLSEVAGVSESRIAVFRGERDIPELNDDPQENHNLLNELQQLVETDETALFAKLAANSTARRLRAKLATKPRKLTDLTTILQQEWGGITNEQTLAMLELCTHAKNNKAEAFLPLRLHLFERTLSGIWACCNPGCSGRIGTALDSPNWKFGKVFIHRREYCDRCQAPVYELINCTQCGTEYLTAQEVHFEDGRYYLLPRKLDFDIDEFQLHLDDQEADEALEEETHPSSKKPGPSQRLIAPMPTDRIDVLALTTREILAGGQGIRVNLIPPEPSSDKLRCHKCDTVEHKEGKIFRFARLGMPFFLGDILPTLLEFTLPPDDEKRKSPFEGRRLLSFTDSRQGSARIAARLQQDADRNYVRSLLYHHLAAANNGEVQSEKLREIQDQIATLEGLVKRHPNLTGTLRSLHVQAAEFSQPKLKRLTWAEAQEKLLGSREVREWMLAEWRRLTGKPLELKRFAEFCLYREFRYRPKRANSSETLGLIALRYPKVEKLNKCPELWKQHGTTLDDWKDLLKLILDYHIRGNTVVTIPPEFVRWMGAKVFPRHVQGPDYSGLTIKKPVLWPHCKSEGPQSRFVKLLALGLDLNPDDRQERDAMNIIFRETWIALHGLFESHDDGYQLSLPREAELESPNKIWICPYTRRLLDTTFRGLSPYVPNLNAHPERCAEIAMPKLPLPFWRNTMGADKSKQEIQEWLDTDPSVTNARLANVWPNRSDRVAAKENWYAIAEHSAQQSTIRLKTLEEDFRNSRVNILSSSTTMEMGIDIGGLSAVAMNNVPPSPANYLQRAGRAGRRDEATSVSVTLCQQNERGSSIFKDPTWPFETPIPVPRARLDSKKLVQRHVNALLLAEYLHTQVDDIAHLNCQWFFEGVDGGDIPAYSFSAWCESTDSRQHGNALSGIQKLVCSSILASQPFEALARETASLMRVLAGKWLDDELRALLDEQDLIKRQNTNLEETPAGKGNQRQLRRLREEYLLRELAGRGFLPGYGFPTGVVCFVNLTIDMLKRTRPQDEEEKHREEVFTFKQGYPSRELSTAIREFAPGAEIVLDGRVYESAGITLNWHMPPGINNVSEIQALRFAWFCNKCGAGGTSQSLLQSCSVCQAGLVEVFQYLQPGGFAVELYYQPHNDVSAPKYLPVKPPRITVNAANWTSLPNPALGRYRYSNNGSILYRNAGVLGVGYSVCLRCGRAAEQAEQGELPAIFQEEHYRLRGDKEADGGHICEGSTQEYAIKRDLWLASEIYSDVFELQFMHADTGRPVEEYKLAYTIGFGLRRSLTRLLGIRETEIGVSVQAATTAAGQEVKSILLYDNVSQGAGYVDELREHLSELLKDTLEALDCKVCDAACHQCLLTIDSQHYADYLDRRQALSFLKSWLRHYELPETLKLFGDPSRAETIEIRQALLRAGYRSENNVVQIFLDGEVEEWHFSEWPLLDNLLSWVREGKQLELHLPQEKIGEIIKTCGNLLAGLIDLGNQKLTVHAIVRQVQLKHEGVLLAGIGNHEKMRYWAAAQTRREPGKEWACCGEQPIIRGDHQAPFKFEAQALDAARLRYVEQNVLPLHITTDFDGDLADFGSRFWSLISAQVEPIQRQMQSGEKIQAITYYDRYLRTPVHAKLLQQIISAFTNNIDEKSAIHIISMSRLPKADERRPVDAWHDWTHDAIRCDVVKQMLRKSLPAKVDFELREKPQMPHSRELRIEWRNGNICTIRPDEGMGCWGIRGVASFPFGGGVAAQVEMLNKMNGQVFMKQKDLGTYLDCRFEET